MRQRVLTTIVGLLAVTLGALATTDYNVKIGGVMITSDNFNNITAANGFTAIKSGTVTYQSYKNILTIKDAEITVTNSVDYALVISDQTHSTSGPLTLVFEGENKLTAVVNVFGVSSDITIKGSGSATLTSTGSYNSGIFINQNHSLTISGTRLYCQGAWGIAGFEGNENLTIDDAYVSVTGSVYGSLRDLKEPTLNNVCISQPAGAVWSTILNALCDAYSGNIITTEVIIKPAGVDVDATNFPDAAFRAWVSESCDANSDGILSTSEIAAMRTINVSQKEIADLTGIEHFTAATFLNCSNNQLKTLDLSKNTALTRLSCGNNKLLTLDVSQNTALTSLGAANNKLTALDLSHNTALTTLTLNDNVLGTLDLSHNTALTTINVCRNILRGEGMDQFIESLPTASTTSCRLTLVSVNASTGYEYNNYTDDNLVAATRKGWQVLTADGQLLVTPINATNFPDAAFRTYILENIDTDGDGILSNSEAAISTLNVAGKGIADLTGLRFFSQLTTLDCSNNQLTSLSLYGNTKLQAIYCNDNQLTSLSQVLRLNELTTLHCYNNKIDGMSSLVSNLREAPTVGTLVGYCTADGEGNAKPTDGDVAQAEEKNWRVYTIDGSGNTQQMTSASGVSITKTNFPDTNFLLYVRKFDTNSDNFLSDDELEAATDIDVTSLGITSLKGIDHFSDATMVRCGNNQLTELDLSKLHYLQTLYAHNNQLQSLIVSKYSDLTYITCDQNQLDWNAIGDLVKSLPVATPEGTLRIYNSKSANERNSSMISSHITAANEKGWKVMSFDNITMTEMEALTGEVAINELNFPDENFRSYVSRNLDRNEDGILSVDEREWANYIVLDKMEITSLKGIEFFPNLGVLWCNKNSLTELDLSKNTNLVVLYCYGNDLTTLDLSACTKLERLVAYANGHLTSIDVSHCPVLKYLDLSHCSLDAIDLTANTELTYLEVRVNNLTALDITNNTKLTALICSLNSLDALDVSHNTALQKLDCAFNNLVALDVSACPALNILEVEGNTIAGTGMDALVSSLPAVSNGTVLVESSSNHNNYITTEQAAAAKAKGWTVQWNSSRSNSQYASFAGHLPVSIDATYFPDARFRNYVKTTFDKDNDGQLSEAEAWTWGVNDNTIDVRGLGITDLTGLGFFIYLEKLYCQENQLQTIDTSYHPYLETLYCYDNSLQGDAMAQLVGGLFKPNRAGVEHGTLVAFSTAGNEGNSPISDDLLSTVNARNWKAYIYDGTSYTELKASYVAINESNFPDATFRQYVSDSCDVNRDKRLSTEEIQKVTTIDVASKRITDMTGVEHFTALQYLICNYNRLTSLDVTRNTELILLDCEWNELKELNVIRNTELILLNCDWNQLNELNVSRNSKLRRLSCLGNDLTELILLKNTELDSLECGYNMLTEIDVSKCTKLKYFDCSRNQLTTLDVSKNKALEYISCYGNQLTTLDVSNCTELVRLYCGENQLTTLDVSNCTELERLSCYKNQLTTLDVSKNKALEYISCYGNQLTTLDVSNCTELVRLYCGENQLTTLDVSNCTELEHLECHDNQLTTLDVSKNISLEDFTCSANQLTALDVSKNTSLVYLYCYNNQLTALDLTKNPLLQNVDCSYNQLTTLDVSRCPMLTEIRCYENRIRGAGMDTFIDGLPEQNYEWGFIYLINLASDTEQNVCTEAQANRIWNKYWKLRARYDDDSHTAGWYDYYGSKDVEGDVNGDGQVGIGDIVAITNVMAGTETDDGVKARADVNGDTEVGIGDIVAITNIMAGTE